MKCLIIKKNSACNYEWVVSLLYKKVDIALLTFRCQSTRDYTPHQPDFDVYEI